MKSPFILGALALAAFAIPVARHHSSATTQQPALTDANIVAIFDAANTADIETSELAAKKGATKDVKDMGTQFAHDHRAVRQQGRDLAKKLGVTPVLPADDKGAEAHRAVMADLNSKTGAAFDKAYVDHEVAFHQAVLDAVTKTLLPAIQNAELKAFVTKVGPAFQGHLVHAQNVQKKIEK
jgi:putative membrane protein